jgi:hypothetical protein
VPAVMEIMRAAQTGASKAATSSPPDDAIVSRINRSYVVQHVEMSGRQLERRPTARERTPVLADGRLLLRNLLLKWR